MIDTANALFGKLLITNKTKRNYPGFTADLYGTKLDGIDPRTFDCFRTLRQSIDQSVTDLRLAASLIGSLEVFTGMLPSKNQPLTRNQLINQKVDDEADLLNSLLSDDLSPNGVLENQQQQDGDDVDEVKSRKRRLSIVEH